MQHTTTHTHYTQHNTTEDRRQDQTSQEQSINETHMHNKKTQKHTQTNPSK